MKQDHVTGMLQDLRGLKASRRTSVERVQAHVKEQNRIEHQITKALGNGPKTVPEIAQETGLPTQTVFWFLMALKKYGKVAEGEKQDSYFTYALKEE
jgi:predicted Rossmann fold nucleotide-binding protein DprA/Smf involved in DNA uptake